MFFLVTKNSWDNTNSYETLRMVNKSSACLSSFTMKCSKFTHPARMSFRQKLGLLQIANSNVPSMLSIYKFDEFSPLKSAPPPPLCFFPGSRRGGQGCVWDDSRPGGDSLLKALCTQQRTLVSASVVRREAI